MRRSAAPSKLHQSGGPGVPTSKRMKFTPPAIQARQLGADQGRALSSSSSSASSAGVVYPKSPNGMSSASHLPVPNIQRSVFSNVIESKENVQCKKISGNEEARQVDLIIINLIMHNNIFPIAPCYS